LVVVSKDGESVFLTPLWPDDELFNPHFDLRSSHRSARWQVHYQLLREWTLEARKAAPHDPRHLIVVPLLASEVQITSDDQMEQLDPDFPMEQVDFAGLRDISDRSIGLLKKHPSVVFVQMSRTRITDDGLAELASIPSLKAIDLYTNWLITDRGVERLRALRPDLVIRAFVLTPWIDVRSAEELAALAPRRKLNRLRLVGAANTDHVIAQLKNHDGLTFVALTHTSITDDGLFAIAGIPSVQGIELDENVSITDAGVKRAAALRPSLVIRRQ